jgi:drug/metabolite transporter (DMT)-like permease
MVLGAAAGFGTIGIFGKLAVAVELPLATLLPVRFALATAAVIVLAVLRNWALPQSARQWAGTFALGIVYTAMTISYFTSLRYLPAGLATIVLYTYPAFVVVLSTAVLNEPVSARTLLALMASMGGVALVVGVDPGRGTGAGVALAVGAAAAYAVYTVGSRWVVATLAPRALMIGALVGTTISMSVYGITSGQLGLPSGGPEWGIVLGLASIGTVVPLVLFYDGVKRLEASHVGIVSTAEPVVTVGLGAILLGEPVTPGVIAGGVLVLGGVVLVQRTREPGRPPSETVSPIDEKS